MAHEYLDSDEDATGPMIYRAVVRGDVGTVERLLDEDPDAINGPDALYMQLLHNACSAAYTELVRLLIQRGADVNARGEFDETPLHHAVREGCPGREAYEITQLLVDSGADIEAKDKRLQQNPLGWALRTFNDDMNPTIHMLLDRGSSIGLEGAMILGDVERVRFLLNESEEQLPVNIVQPVFQLAETCAKHEIAALIKDWFSRKQAQHGSAT